MRLVTTIIGLVTLGSLALFVVTAIVVTVYAVADYFIEKQTKRIRKLIEEHVRLNRQRQADTFEKRGLVKICRECIQFPCACTKKAYE